jgi:hypothetical protein
MAEPIVYIDHSKIRPGGLDEVKKAIPELVRFVDEHEPRLISYGFYIDALGSAMTVVAVHPDSASLESQLEIGGPQFRKLAAFIDLRLIEVYGEPSGTALNQLRQKADMLGEDAQVVAHELQGKSSSCSMNGPRRVRASCSALPRSSWSYRRGRYELVARCWQKRSNAC